MKILKCYLKSEVYKLRRKNKIPPSMRKDKSKRYEDVYNRKLCDATHKICYDTRSSAKSGLKSFRSNSDRRKIDSPETLCVYNCKHCGMWHIGNSFQRSSRMA